MRIQAFKEITENKKWEDMKEIWELCKTNKIPIPQEVINYFEGGEPHFYGISVNINNLVRCRTLGWKHYADIRLCDLPSDISMLRFLV